MWHSTDYRLHDYRPFTTTADPVDIVSMSIIGSPLDTSLIQAAQAQQVASKARDRERAVSDQSQRYKDMLDLKIAGIESAEAARQLPHSDSEQAEVESEARKEPATRDSNPDEHIDLTA